MVRKEVALVALAALLVAAGCSPGVPPAQEKSTVAETRAALILIEGLQEGGTTGRGFLSDTTLVAFFRNHVAFADARLLVGYFAPNARIDVTTGRLKLDGTDTGISVELREGVSFIPVQPVADHFRAYARIEESPGRMVTLWRHEVLCLYARDADRRAEVFLEAAEQGLLRYCDPPIEARVRRWASALSNERWAASVTLRQALDSVNSTALLNEYGAAPYAAYGVVAGHHLIVRVPPDSASLRVISLLRAAGIEALERALCGLAARRDRGIVRRRHGPGVDPFRGERQMLAGVLAARRELPRVRAGPPIVFGVNVVANVPELRRLASDARVWKFEPATKLDDTWLVPGADVSGAGAVPVPSDIAALDSAALFARLEAEAARAAAECPRRGRR